MEAEKEAVGESTVGRWTSGWLVGKFDRCSRLENKTVIKSEGQLARRKVGVLIAAPRNETNERTSRVDEGAGVELAARQSGSMPPRHVCARKRAHVCVHLIHASSSTKPRRCVDPLIADSFDSRIEKRNAQSARLTTLMRVQFQFNRYETQRIQVKVWKRRDAVVTGKFFD